MRILISAEQIAARVREMAAAIDADYTDGTLYLVGVLKGASVFLADLARAIRRPVRFDFIGISSYGSAQSSSGEVKLTKDLDVSVAGCHVLIVEDIIDTGVTLSYLMRMVEQREPRSLRVAALLDKPERRELAIDADYVGFQIPNEFVVGYGMDFAEDHRSLPNICVLE